MSTMPPISSFGSAPLMSLSSPAVLTPSIQSRRSLLAIVLRSGSVWLKSNRLNQAGVHVDFPLELVCERLRRYRRRQSSQTFQAVAHARCFQRLDDLPVQAIHERTRRRGGGKRADPELVVRIGETCFGRRRHVRQRNSARRTRDRQRLKLSAR